jgi:ABC-type branched-subunit amino acid transport system ATPase component
LLQKRALGRCQRLGDHARISQQACVAHSAQKLQRLAASANRLAAPLPLAELRGCPLQLLLLDGNRLDERHWDEPFAALDVQTRAKMQDFLLQIWRDSGASVLLVTHSIDEAIALADRVVVFTARPGRVKSIVPIDLPRPRPTRHARYHELRDHFAELLADEVDRAFAEQEARVSV